MGSVTVVTAAATEAAPDLAEILAERPDPVKLIRSIPWAKRLAKIPADAAPPLAMSGPHPRAVGSYGPDCIKWAKRELGITLRWWQQLAITRQLEHDDDGALVWSEIVETGPRRIGKSVRLRVVALWRLAHADRFHETQLAMLVSKDLAVGKEIHRGAWRWAETKGWGVTRLNGAQEITTPAEDRWLLRAPNAVYGYDVGYGQADEAWDIDPMAITDGLEPAMLERHSPQLHLTSTAHVKASSLMRRRLVGALRGSEDVLLLMWGAHPDDDYDDRATWRKASPHWTAQREKLMSRKYAAALAGEADPETDDPDPVRGWAAQYLNVWPLLLGPSGDSILPRWGECLPGEDEEDEDFVPAALGIAADLDQTWLSLAASSADDRPHLGAVLRVRVNNRDHFVDEVARIRREYDLAVALDAKGPASFLLPYLEKAGVDVTAAGLDDRVQADSDLEKAVAALAITHGDHPDLNTAVDAAGWRTVGERRVFARKNGDASMLEAASLARWAAETVGAYDPLDNVW